MKSLRLAVVGKDVSKSDSPAMHKFIAERLGIKISYEKISIPEEEFEGKAEGLFAKYDGFNVTIPYKLSVMPYLKRICGDAPVFGAVNTVKCREREGYNTDGLGFALMLENAGIDVQGKKILLLGAGGAGRSVTKKLMDGGARTFVYDRRKELAERLQKEFGACAQEEPERDNYFAIINATGVGMHKTEGVSPAGDELISGCEIAIDLIYKPEKSEFLRRAEALGKRILNGKAMLFYQAYFAECIYADVKPSNDVAKKLFEEWEVV